MAERGPAEVLGEVLGQERQVKIMKNNYVSRQTRDEFVKEKLNLTNKGEAISRLIDVLKNTGAPAGEMMKGIRLRSTLLGRPVFGEERKLESPALKQLSFGPELEGIGHVLGRVRIVEGEAANYQPEQKELRLGEDGALAVAVFAHYFPIELRSAAPAIIEMMEGRTYAGGAKSYAHARFFLLLAESGLEHVFDELDFGRTELRGLMARRGLAYAQETREELMRMHTEYVKVLYRGSDALEQK